MSLLVWIFIAAFYSQNTLAPHPINFTHEEVEVDGQVYVVTFEHGQLSMKEKGDLNGRFKSRVEFLQNMIYRKGPEDYRQYGVPTRPPEETWGQLIGCFFSGVFFLAACIVLMIAIGWRIYSYLKTKGEKEEVAKPVAQQRFDLPGLYLVKRSA